MLNTTDDTDSLGGSEHSSNSSFSLNRTVRDYGERITSLQRENFDLKLRIFLLEERLSVRSGLEVSGEEEVCHTEKQVREGQGRSPGVYGPNMSSDIHPVYLHRIRIFNTELSSFSSISARPIWTTVSSWLRRPHRRSSTWRPRSRPRRPTTRRGSSMWRLSWQ